jgi:hypothetical protein
LYLFSLQKVVFLNISYIFFLISSFCLFKARGFFFVSENGCTAAYPPLRALCVGFCGGLAAVRCSTISLFFIFFLSTSHWTFFVKVLLSFSVEIQLSFFCRSSIGLDPSVFIYFVFLSRPVLSF